MKLVKKKIPVLIFPFFCLDQDSLACRVQQLLQGSFPEIVVPATDSEEELLSLDDLLHTQPLPETEGEKTELSSTQWSGCPSESGRG